MTDEEWDFVLPYLLTTGQAPQGIEGAHRGLYTGPPVGADGHAGQGDREQAAALAGQVQEVTGHSVKLAYVDQGYPGAAASEAAQQQGIRLEVVNHPMAKRGFVLLPRRWAVERSFAWAARLRRLARDYERLPTTLRGLHSIGFAILMTAKLVNLATASS